MRTKSLLRLWNEKALSPSVTPESRLSSDLYHSTSVSFMSASHATWILAETKSLNRFHIYPEDMLHISLVWMLADHELCVSDTIVYEFLSSPWKLNQTFPFSFRRSSKPRCCSWCYLLLEAFWFVVWVALTNHVWASGVHLEWSCLVSSHGQSKLFCSTSTSIKLNGHSQQLLLLCDVTLMSRPDLIEEIRTWPALLNVRIVARHTWELCGATRAKTFRRTSVNTALFSFPVRFHPETCSATDSVLHEAKLIKLFSSLFRSNID